MDEVSILYGLDSLPRPGGFEPGEQLRIEVSPFRTHLLRYLMMSTQSRRCVAPELIVVGIDPPADGNYCNRGREQAGFALGHDEDGRIVSEEDSLVVMRNEVVAVSFRIIEPIDRVTVTIVGAQAPTTVARNELFAELWSISDTFAGEPKPALQYAAQLHKVASLWEQYVHECRELEVRRAIQRGVQPLDDEQLGLAPGDRYRLVPEAAAMADKLSELGQGGDGEPSGS